MTQDEFDKSLRSLYQQRKEAIKSPISADDIMATSQKKPKLKWSGLIIMSVFASGGLLALMNSLLEEPSSRSVTQPPSRHIEIEKEAALAPSEESISVAQPLPQKPTPIETPDSLQSKPDAIYPATEISTVLPQVKISLNDVAPKGINDESSIIVHKVLPQYPQSLMSSKKQGHVTFYYLINTSGKVEEINTESWHGDRAFVRAGRKALSQWRYKPMSKSKKALITFDFTLE